MIVRSSQMVSSIPTLRSVLFAVEHEKCFCMSPSFYRKHYFFVCIYFQPLNITYGNWKKKLFVPFDVAEKLLFCLVDDERRKRGGSTAFGRMTFSRKECRPFDSSVECHSAKWCSAECQFAVRRNAECLGATSEWERKIGGYFSHLVLSLVFLSFCLFNFIVKKNISV